MRKFTLLLTFVALSSILSAQVAKEGRCTLSALKAVNDYSNQKKSVSLTKTAGDIYFEEDFDETEWAQYEGGMKPGWRVVDLNNEDFVWKWSKEGPRGALLSPNAGDPREELEPRQEFVDMFDRTEGCSAENGFLLLESNYYNTTIAGETPPQENKIPMDTYVQLDSVNLSNVPGATLIFNQLFIWCCGDDRLSVFVSNDWSEDNDNSHWREYDVRGVRGDGNEWTFAEDRTMEVDISEFAGSSKVTIRWRKIDATDYVWFVDDVRIIEPNSNDIIVQRGWWDYGYEYTYDEDYDGSLEFYGGYAHIPGHQINDFVNFRAAIVNFGITDQTGVKYNIKINKDDAEVYNESSEGKTVEATVEDTLHLRTSFTPTGKGHYQVSGTVSMDTEDENPINNHTFYEFYVENYTYARTYVKDDYTKECSSRDWSSGGNDSDNLAVWYDFENPATAMSITTFIGDNDDNISDIQAGNYQLIARLYAYDEDENALSTAPKVSSILHVVTEDEINTWITLPLVGDGEELRMEEGSYVAALEFYSGGGDDYRFYVGGDDALQQPWYAYYGLFSGNWFWLGGFPPVINLNTKDPNAQPIVTFNVNMTGVDGFTAGTDKVYISGSFADWAEAGTDTDLEMTDIDADGIYTVTVEMATGDYEYKYYINDADGAEGIDNRTLTVTGDMTVNNVFDVPTGIDKIDITNITMYPNPVNNELTIANMNNVERIVISNIIGQEVINMNNVQNAVKISTSDLDQGVYVVTFIDANNNAKSTRIIKK